MTAFHSPEYINHLKNVAPQLLSGADDQLLQQNGQNPYTSSVISLNTSKEDFKVGENDCPCFSGMFEFS